jgi:hypothetical protein
MKGVQRARGELAVSCKDLVEGTIKLISMKLKQCQIDLRCAILS